MSSKTKLFSACFLQTVNMATNGKVTKLIIIHKIIIIKLNEIKRNSNIPRIEPRTLNHKSERSTAKPRQLSRNVALNSLRIRQYCGIGVLTVHFGGRWCCRCRCSCGWCSCGWCSCGTCRCVLPFAAASPVSAGARSDTYTDSPRHVSLQVARAALCYSKHLVLMD